MEKDERMNPKLDKLTLLKTVFEILQSMGNVFAIV